MRHEHQVLWCIGDPLPTSLERILPWCADVTDYSRIIIIRSSIAVPRPGGRLSLRSRCGPLCFFPGARLFAGSFTQHSGLGIDFQAP